MISLICPLFPDICPNDLYGELNSLWDNAKEEFRKVFVKFAPTTVPAETASWFAMRQGWDIYIQGIEEFAQQYSKILLNSPRMANKLNPSFGPAHPINKLCQICDNVLYI